MTEIKTDERFLTKGLVAFVALLFVGTLIHALWGISQVPEGTLVPTHWNAAGEVDGWGSRWMMLMGPGLQLFMVVLMPLIAKVEPRRQHMSMSYGPLRTLLVAMAVLFAGISVMVVLSALGEEIDTGRWMIIGMGAVFMVIGNMLGKIRSTFTFGIRTPWTLSSEVSWVKTHRVTGIAWTALGAIVLLMGLLDVAGDITIWILMIGVFGTLAFVMIYSYYQWKHDPNRKETP